MDYKKIIDNNERETQKLVVLQSYAIQNKDTRASACFQVLNDETRPTLKWLRAIPTLDQL